MPGIDFRQARLSVRLAEVLELLGFEPSARRGDEPLVRGRWRQEPVALLPLRRRRQRAGFVGGGDAATTARRGDRSLSAAGA